MSKIYEKLAKVRDENRKLFKESEEPVFVFLEEKEDVLKKLLFISFFNETKPGELPEDFTLEAVMLFQGQLEALMEALELNVTITKVGYSYPSGFNYRITKT